MNARSEDLEFIIEIAKNAGAIANKFRHGSGSASDIETKKKPDHTIVTIVDPLIENSLREQLLGKFPGTFIGEENGTHTNGKNGVYSIIVDPIDGTSGYATGIGEGSYPLSKNTCISIAIHKEQKPYIGVIHNFTTNETVYAESGKGAFIEDRDARILPLFANGKTSFQHDAQRLSIHFGYFSNENKGLKQKITDAAKMFASSNNMSDSTRIMGSTAWELCFLACSAGSAYVGQCSPWDYAAGIIIAEESGAKVLVVNSKLEAKDLVIAAHPDIFPVLQQAYEHHEKGLAAKKTHSLKNSSGNPNSFWTDRHNLGFAAPSETTR